MPASLSAFHDVLAPVFHMERGAERDTRTCAAVPDFERAAAAVVADPKASNQPLKDGAADLAAAVKTLATTCKASPSHADLEASLGSLHQAFHRAMESAQ